MASLTAELFGAAVGGLTGFFFTRGSGGYVQAAGAAAGAFAGYEVAKLVSEGVSGLLGGAVSQAVQRYRLPGYTKPLPPPAAGQYYTNIQGIRTNMHCPYGYTYRVGSSGGQCIRSGLF